MGFSSILDEGDDASAAPNVGGPPDDGAPSTDDTPAPGAGGGAESLLSDAAPAISPQNAALASYLDMPPGFVANLVAQTGLPTLAHPLTPEFPGSIFVNPNFDFRDWNKAMTMTWPEAPAGAQPAVWNGDPASVPAGGFTGSPTPLMTLAAPMLAAYQASSQPGLAPPPGADSSDGDDVAPDAPANDTDTAVAANTPGHANGGAAPDVPAQQPDWSRYQPQPSASADVVANIANGPAPQLPNSPENGPFPRKAPAGHYHVIPGHNFPTDATFAPDAADALTGAIAEMNAQGIEPKITDGFRTAAQQQYMREHPGAYPVAKGPSWHQTGKAMDMDSQQKDFDKIATIMRNHGFYWGGDFSKKNSDRVHFQYGAKPGASPTPAMLHSYGGN